MRTMPVAALAIATILFAAGTAHAAGALDQEYAEAQTACPSVTAGHPAAQTFTSNITGPLVQVDLNLARIVDGGNVTVEVRSVAGGLPSTTVLASTFIASSAVPATPAWVSFGFASPAAIESGGQYAIVLSVASGEVAWCLHNPGNYSAGQGVTGTTLTDPLPSDYNFRTWVMTQCTDGIDNDGNGRIDYPADLGCSTPTDVSESCTFGTGPGCPVTPTTPTATDPGSAPGGGTPATTVPGSSATRRVDANATLLECAHSSIAITDISQRSGRVRILGVTKSANAGETIQIAFRPADDVVATAVVNGDGSFRATAPLPPRSIRNTDKARYRASLGTSTTPWLKLTRRLAVSGLHGLEGDLDIGGRLLGPRVKGARITITTQTDCDAPPKVLGHIAVDSDGSFGRLVGLPETTSGLVVRLSAVVRSAGGGTATTYSIARPVQIR